MTHFPALTYREVIKKIRKCGFIFYREAKGSHELWVREFDKNIITVSNHRGRIIKRKTLKKIIEATRLSIEEFNQL